MIVRIFTNKKVQTERHREHPLPANGRSPTGRPLETLDSLELGTWFEFHYPKSPRKLRGKLVWFNAATRNFLFVNQAGRQIAAKTSDHLAQEIEQGIAKIITVEERPFADRAMQSIQGLFKKMIMPSD